MKFRTVLAFTTAACLVLAIPASSQTSEQAAKPSTEALIDLDFPGGTVASYVELIRKARQDANIVVMSDVSKISMPPATLRSVDVWAALNLLNALPERQQDQVIEVHVDREQSGRSQPVYLLAINAMQVKDAQSRALRVMDVSDLLQKTVKPADLLTAIETSLGMMKGSVEPAQIRYHEETGLVIVRGTAEQLNGVQQVVEEVRNQTARRDHQEQANAAATEAHLKMQALTVELAKANHQIQASEGRITALQEEMARLSRTVEDREKMILQLEQELAAIRAGAPKR